ncbi:MAG: heavy metal translocating P-type ATPase [Armatimonadota bacterium]|nr:heavy metal translocating P-type ATPase [Armatimonadota bacterium]
MRRLLDFLRPNPQAVQTAICGGSLLVGWFLELAGGPRLLVVGFYLLSLASGGYESARRSLVALMRRVVDVNLLMILAAVGASALGYWKEGAILMLLFSLSNTLEGYAMERTRRAIQLLMNLRPQEARVRRNGEEALVPIEAVEPGDLVIVRPGDQIPVDGKVEGGESWVDQGSITGEALPVQKVVGSEVYAGTLNLQGILEIRVTRPAGDTTLAKILKLVETAQSQKARTQHFAEWIGRYYTLAVVTAAIALLLLSPLQGDGWEQAFYRAMTLLVVASPCALVLSTPSTILAAIANGARHGVLFKGGTYLEILASVKTLAFDKTGTLTLGRPQVTEVIPARIEEQEVLRLAASAERLSGHPLGNALVEEAQRRGLVLYEVREMEEIPGRGVRAVLNGRGDVLVGNRLLMESARIAIPDEMREAVDRLERSGNSVMFVATPGFSNGECVGVIATSDVVRPGTEEALKQVRSMGIQRLVMLTGDNLSAARSVSERAGVTEVFAGLLPHAKVEVLQGLKGDGPVGMVGDGINDAPALASASVGIAMGGIASDVAMETADVVLMAPTLEQLPYAIALSRKAQRIIRQNIAIALTVIVLLIAGAFLGWLRLPLAVVGHEGSTVVVILNGLRLLRFRPSPILR